MMNRKEKIVYLICLVLGNVAVAAIMCTVAWIISTAPLPDWFKFWLLS